MTAKKIEPTNPAVAPKATKDAEDKTDATRKTASDSHRARKSGRKTSAGHYI